MGIRIALAGNPNSGKTTLFNALTGSNQYVGNWPGVTVEKKEGKLKKHTDVTLTDLPGIYSLSPYTTEEIVARDYLIDEKPEAIINIVDGTNLERNLYLTTQLVELGIPVVIAINMMDVVRKNGDKIDCAELSRQLGCPVLEISALKGTGIDAVAQRAVTAAQEKPTAPQHSFSGCVEHALAHIEERLLHDLPAEQQRWYAIKLFESDERVIKKLGISENDLKHIAEDIKAAEDELDDDAESIITNERYVYIASVLRSCYKKANKGKLSTSDKIDKIVTNRFLGLPIFAAVMFLVYYIAMQTVGAWGTDWVNDVLFGEWIPGAMSTLLEGRLPDWLFGLLNDGIVGGVGAVLGFVPQILVLFVMLAFLEGCGYMARVAFVMDRVFRHFGLSGKSFIPMLIGTGCGVPGIMASRTIENERDRRMTIMTTTFVPCSAKLPIIGLIAGALFGESGLVVGQVLADGDPLEAERVVELAGLADGVFRQSRASRPEEGVPGRPFADHSGFEVAVDAAEVDLHHGAGMEPDVVQPGERRGRVRVEAVLVRAGHFVLDPVREPPEEGALRMCGDVRRRVVRFEGQDRREARPGPLSRCSTVIRAGMSVRFYPVTRGRFDEIARDERRGAYRFEYEGGERP